MFFAFPDKRAVRVLEPSIKVKDWGVCHDWLCEYGAGYHTYSHNGFVFGGWPRGYYSHISDGMGFVFLMGGHTGMGCTGGGRGRTGPVLLMGGHMGMGAGSGLWRRGALPGRYGTLVNIVYYNKLLLYSTY